MTRHLRRAAFLALAALGCMGTPAIAHAAHQVLVVFPPHVLGSDTDNVLRAAVPVLEQEIKARLEDRFDIRPLGEEGASAAGARRLHLARILGANYVLNESLSRIGREVQLDITIAPIEEPAKGRTVVVSGRLENPSMLTVGDLSLFRRLGLEGSLKLKYLFFGDERVGEGPEARKIPKPAGVVTRSVPIPGAVVSVAISDVDLDGKTELVAAYPDAVVIYGVIGDDLREKARIPYPGMGLIHVDAASVTRKGVGDIVATRYVGGEARSDIWRYDGREYRKLDADLPCFLRTADMGPEGIVLLGQASDPMDVYKGPVFRVPIGSDGRTDLAHPGPALPLPRGVFLYGFAPLRMGKREMRYAVLTARDRLVYLDSAGKELWEGLTAVTSAELVVDGAARHVRVPGRLVAADLDGNGTDELLLLNDLVAAGTFFENLRLYAQVELLCFAQGADNLQLAWRSPQWDASGRDLFVDRTVPGVVRFGVASRERTKVLSGAGQWQLLWVK
jgi:hypothetical protein